MNKYEITFESQDKRVWQITVKADGFSEREDTVVFWCGWWRRNVHMIAKDCLISVIENK